MNDSTKSGLISGGMSLLGTLVLGLCVMASRPMTQVQPTVVAPQPASVIVQPVAMPQQQQQAEPTGQEDPQLGGRVHNIQEDFGEGISVDGVEVITGSGTLKLGAGTAIDKHLRTTTSLNVSSMGPAQTTSSPVTLTGAATGDHCNAAVTAGDYLSTTGTGLVACEITASNTATLFFRNTSGTAAFDAGNSTFSIQAWSY
jgi:hypothetical protein